ncbi:4Fe-4S binding protein [Thermovorax subterraneus]|nr:4Fe-4S binding protein [Thermovorax subterraneus]
MLKQQGDAMRPSESFPKVKYLYGPVATIFASTKTGSWRILRPVIQQEKCTRCGTCAKHCPLDVIEVDRGNKEKEVVIDFEYCKGCGICANVCPRKCIEMVPERGVK